MGGAFRDDEVAARQRADVLDERVRELEAEKLALEARLSGGPPSGSTPQRRGPSLASIVLSVGSLGLVSTLFVVRALPVAVLVAVMLMAMTLVWAIVLRQYVTAAPGMVWVVTGGRAQPQADGSVRNYRLLLPGQRRLLLPLVEVATSMSLRPFRVSVRMEHAFARGGTVARARVVAMMGLDRANLAPAVERFLGQPESAVVQVAEAALEGALREALADTDAGRPQELESALRAALDDDLERLGLALDTLLSIEVRPVSG